MNKKNIIIGIIAIVMVALIVAVFAMSSDVPKVSKDIMLTVDGAEYTIDDFKTYKYIKNEANGDIAKALTVDELTTMVDEFVQSKVYVSAANKKGIRVPSEDEETYKKDYETKASTYKKYGISESDYLRYARDEYKENELSGNFANYYELPEEYYNDFVDSYTEDKRSYEYRIMMFAYDANVSGDASGDNSGDVSGDSDISKSRENVLAKAENVLAEVKASGDFEALAKENASYRITFKGADYAFVNGEIEYAASPVLESKVNSHELYHALTEINSGETTEVIEDTDGSAFYFAKLESVQDGFVGEAADELKDLLLLQYAQTLIMKDVVYEVNNSAVMRVLYNN